MKTLLTAFAALVVLSVDLPNTNAAEEIDGIIAKVNGKSIKRSDIQRQISAQFILIDQQIPDPNQRAKLKKELREAALEEMINKELIVTHFRDVVKGSIKEDYITEHVDRIVRDRFGGDRRKFIEQLAKDGMSLTQFEKLQEEIIIVQLMRGQKTRQLPPPTPAEVRAEYEARKDELRDKSQDKVSLYSISIPMVDVGKTPEDQQALAQEIRRKLMAGADFASMARSYSQDSKADEGGGWGWVSRENLSDTIGNAAFMIPPKSVGPVIQDVQFLRILYVDARVLGKAPTFEESRSTMEKYALQKKSKEIQDRWIELLRKDAVIRRY